MATTEQFFNGGTNSFSFSIEYIKAQDIKVKVDGGTPLTYVASGPNTGQYTISGTTLTIGGATTASGTGNIHIYRETDLDSAAAVFAAGSSIRASDLNACHDMVRLASQEQNQVILTSDLKDEAITTAKIANGAVTTPKLASQAVTTAKIADDAVTTAKIADNAVIATKILDSSITTTKISNQAVTKAKIADQSVSDTILESHASTDDLRAVGTNHIKDQAVTSAKIANNSIVNADINSSAAIDGTKISPSFSQAITTTGDAITIQGNSPRLTFLDNNADDYYIEANGNNLSIRHYDSNVGGGTPPERLRIEPSSTIIKNNLDAESGLDVTGNITVTGTVDGRDVATDGTKLDTIATNADVTSTKNLGDLANVNTTGKADGKILKYQASSSSFIVADESSGSGSGSTTFTGLTDTPANYTANKVLKVNSAGDAIEFEDIATVNLQDSAVISSKIANDAVTSSKINNQAVITNKINPLAVTTAKINNSAVTTAKLADDSVTADKIQDGNVTTAKIDATAVTNAKLADNAVTAAKIDSNAVTEAKIASSAVTVSKIDSNAVNQFKLATNAVVTNKINDGAVTTAKIADDAITGDKLSNNLDIPDNNKIRFGTGNDLELFHDGNQSRINDAGTGGLILSTNDFKLQNAASNENLINAVENGAVELYFDATKTFETTNTGTTTSGISTTTGAGTVGFKVPDNPAVSSGSSTHGFLLVGNDNDLQVYHNETDSYVDNHTGHLYIRNNVDDDDGGNIILQAKSGENGIVINDDGSVQLFQNSNEKFYTNSSGVQVVGNIKFSGDLRDDSNSHGSSAQEIFDGRAKAYVNFDGTGTPPSIRASIGVSSVTDDDSGKYVVNFSSSFGDDNYIAVASGGGDDTNSQVGSVEIKDPSGTSLKLFNENVDGAIEDKDYIYLVVFDN